MTFEDYLQTNASEVNLQLDQFFKSWNKNISTLNPLISHLSQQFETSTEGGKRIRGVLVKLGYELSAPTTNSQPRTTDIMAASVAFEIFQTAILAHDDIIDKSPLRRGKPTLYKALGGDHYGISQTICLGDLGFFLANQLILKTNFPDLIKLQAVEVFTQTVMDTIMGEMLDVEGTSDIIQLAILKTSQYTTTGPLSLGAVLGGANQSMLDLIKQFGDNLGIAFQIQDDILGVFGDEAKTGKSASSDAEEGKNTTLIIQARKQANSAQTARLDELYGKNSLSEGELTEIRQIFENTGALDYSKQIALEYVDRAKKVIPEITSSPEYQGLLSGLAEMLVNRQK